MRVPHLKMYSLGFFSIQLGCIAWWARWIFSPVFVLVAVVLECESIWILDQSLIMDSFGGSCVFLLHWKCYCNSGHFSWNCTAGILKGHHLPGCAGSELSTVEHVISWKCEWHELSGQWPSSLLHWPRASLVKNLLLCPWSRFNFWRIWRSDVDCHGYDRVVEAEENKKRWKRVTSINPFLLLPPCFFLRTVNVSLVSLIPAQDRRTWQCVFTIPCLLVTVRNTVKLSFLWVMSWLISLCLQKHGFFTAKISVSKWLQRPTPYDRSPVPHGEAVWPSSCMTESLTMQWWTLCFLFHTSPLSQPNLLSMLLWTLFYFVCVVRLSVRKTSWQMRSSYPNLPLFFF